MRTVLLFSKVCSVIVAVSHVEDYGQSTRFMAASMLRKVLGGRNLTDVLSDRKGFNEAMKKNINEATIMMGIRVERVEINSMSFPVGLRRAMAVEGLATREALANQEFATGERNWHWPPRARYWRSRQLPLHCVTCKR